MYIKKSDVKDDKRINALKYFWKVYPCSTENCWCSWIGFARYKSDDQWVIPTGSILTAEAKHIVKLHNAWLKRTKHVK